jgi:penicillin-binding protein 1C
MGDGHPHHDDHDWYEDDDRRQRVDVREIFKNGILEQWYRLVFIGHELRAHSGAPCLGRAKLANSLHVTSPFIMQIIPFIRTVADRVGAVLTAPAGAMRRTIGGLLVLFLLADVSFPVPVSVPPSTMVTDRNGEVLTMFLSSDQRWRFPAALEDMSPELREAFIAKEDRWFRWHPGINPLAMVRALWTNLSTGRRMSGASTISMQVVRLLEPRPRTLWSKVVESFRALQLELHLSKDDILTLYMNLVPYGGNIEGVTAAALLYFERPPKQLSTAEMVTLLIVPNRPTSLRPGAAGSPLITERNRWLRILEGRGILEPALVADAVAEPLTLRRSATPRMAWHASVRLQRALPGRLVIRTTLDRSMQEKVETLVADHVRRLRIQGIGNAAAIIIDNATGEIRASVGSADATDVLHLGANDGVRAIRSPGSTLKPLLYALAMDAGLLTPKTRLDDVPININGYAPQNFDATYRGSVTMEDALAESLNIPAVTVLSRLGVPRFVDALARAGAASTSRQRSDVGLSMVLGGCGIRLDELTALYAAFARKGMWIAPTLLPRTSQPQERRLISEASAWAITEVLSRPPADLAIQVTDGARIPRIAWKTGTSYGRRDAWTIGYNRRFTVGVWVGHFDGRGVSELTGATCAAPLMMDIVHAIDRSAADAGWLQQPATIDQREVCSVSGRLPSDSCHDRTLDLFIPGVSSAERCTHRRPVLVANDGSVSFCATCAPQKGYRTEWFETISPALLAYYRDNAVALRTPPPHYNGCTKQEGGLVTITAPTEGAEYVLERNGEKLVRLTARVPDDATTVYWYVNGVFTTSAPAGQPAFFQPERGTHTVTCMDDRGREATVTLTIRYW